MRMVRVLWVDAQGDAHGWTPLGELEPTPCLVSTVGHLVEPSPRPDHLTVALSTYGGESGTEVNVDSVVHLPMAMVRLVQNLSVDLTTR